MHHILGAAHLILHGIGGHNEQGVGLQRGYLTVIYSSLESAYNDWDSIYRSLKDGDVIQVFSSSGIFHSMIIQKAGVKTMYNNNDILYAQHSDNGKNISLFWWLKTKKSSNPEWGIVFHRIKE